MVRSFFFALKVNRLWKASSSRLFKRYLIVTNTVCSGGLMGLGDITAQTISRFSSSRQVAQITDGEKVQRPSHDWRRTLRMTAVGLGMGPVAHLWYLYLDVLIASTRTSAVLSKIALDQIVASPCFTYMFFAQVGALENKSLSHVNQEFAQKFLPLYMVDCTVWPIAQGVNFYFVPSAYRVLFVCGISYFWNIYLLHVKHKQTS